MHVGAYTMDLRSSYLRMHTPRGAYAPSGPTRACAGHAYGLDMHTATRFTQNKSTAMVIAASSETVLLALVIVCMDSRNHKRSAMGLVASMTCGYVFSRTCAASLPRQLSASALALVLLLVSGGMGNLNVTSVDVESTSVFTAEELQDAVVNGVKHIVVNNHLNMDQVPHFSEVTGRETVMDSAKLAVWRTSSGKHTSTIRVRSPTGWMRGIRVHNNGGTAACTCHADVRSQRSKRACAETQRGESRESTLEKSPRIDICPASATGVTPCTAQRAAWILRGIKKAFSHTGRAALPHKGGNSKGGYAIDTEGEAQPPAGKT